jgi:hypothetical protein
VPTFEINDLFESRVIAIGLDGNLLSADRSGQIIHSVRHRDPQYLTENGRREDPRLLTESERQAEGI